MDGRNHASFWSGEPPQISERELLEWCARISDRAASNLQRLQLAEAEAKAKARHDRELLEFVATISGKPEDERKLRALLEREAEERAEQEKQQRPTGAEATQEVWDSSKHPRGGFSQNRGWWSPTGSAGGGAQVPSNYSPVNIPHGAHATRSGSSGRSASAGRAESTRAGSTGAGPFQLAAYRPGGASIKLTAATGGAPAGNWPVYDPATLAMPKVGGAVGAAGVAASIGAVGFATALRNASMIRYWERVPATQVMPEHWAYELDKRIRAGTLSREDAIGIFSTTVLGAQAQEFKPTGNIMSAVHRSMMDFLDKAEATYFARKREIGWAKQRGGYQLSGGRVFPTKHNSGLDGDTLRQEQEKFFDQGLAEGKDPSYLRGQAAEAGSPRAGGWGKPNDRIVDPEAEAALQRAIKKAKR